MKIADIQIIPIRPRLAARYADREVWFEGIDRRTIFKVLTDNGLVGYGDYDYWVDDGPEEYRRASARLDESGSFSEGASE